MKVSKNSEIKEYFEYQKLTIFKDKKLSNFLEKSQLIHIVGFLDSYRCLKKEKFFKLYILLFQFIKAHMITEELKKILPYYSFVEMVEYYFSQKQPCSQKILLIQVGNLLDSTKEKQCSLLQMNSLVHRYQDYRLLEYFKNLPEHSILACKFIQQYLEIQFEIKRQEIFESQWKDLNRQDFIIFYEQYSKLCQIEKRISYVHCKSINLKNIEIGQSQSRFSIEQKYKQIKKQQKVIQEHQPVLSVKKNLRNMANMIKKMTNDLK